MTTSRRRFLGLVPSLAGCASLLATEVEAPGGVVALRRDDHPTLRDRHGVLRLALMPKRTPYFVINTDAGLVALSATCSHQGCALQSEGQLLVCPCHGSAFDHGGRVVRGPATEPLSSYEVTVQEDQDLLKVHLGGSR